MKKLITILAVTVFCLSFAAISTAQDAGPQGGQLQGHQRRGPGLKIREKIEKDVLATLNLTDAQKQAIDDLDKKTMDQLKDLRDQAKNATGDKKNVGVQVRKVMQDRQDTLRTILTPDQWKQYREGILAKMKEYREQQEHPQQTPAASTGAPTKP